jgi:hypothetical protein
VRGDYRPPDTRSTLKSLSAPGTPLDYGRGAFSLYDGQQWPLSEIDWAASQMV